MLNSLDVRRTSHSGVADKSDRIFIDAKLAISSPVTIPELCISLGDSRFEVYPSRSFPSAASTRSTLFHAGSFLPSQLPPPRPPSRPFLYSLPLILRSQSSARSPPSSLRPLPSFGPFLQWKRHLLVERKGGKREDTLGSDQSR